MRPGRRWCAVQLGVVCAGCGPQPYDESKPADQPAADLAAQAAASARPCGSAPAWPTTCIAGHAHRTAAAAAGGRGGAFTWSAQPDLGAVPATMVTGRLRNQDFIARYAAVSVAEEAKQPVLRLRFSSLPKGDIAGFSLDDDAVQLNWSTPLEPGTVTRQLDEPRPPTLDAWFVIEQADGVPLTQSAPFACLLQLDEVRGPVEPGGAPSLLGRLAICFDDEAKSWLAGTFAADGVR